MFAPFYASPLSFSLSGCPYLSHSSLALSLLRGLPPFPPSVILSLFLKLPQLCGPGVVQSLTSLGVAWTLALASTSRMESVSAVAQP